MKFTASNVPDGFYILSMPNGDDPCLVKVYMYEGERCLGYGRWDGAGLVPLRDTNPEAPFLPVVISMVCNGMFDP